LPAAFPERDRDRQASKDGGDEEGKREERRKEKEKESSVGLHGDIRGSSRLPVFEFVVLLRLHAGREGTIDKIADKVDELFAGEVDDESDDEPDPRADASSPHDAVFKLCVLWFGDQTKDQGWRIKG